jgi:adenylate kinase family enzyme
MAAGKTTIASLLAQKLGIMHHELDARRLDYYNEVGYDQALAAQIRSEEGFSGLYRYWKPFEIHAVERVLADCTDGVISFGAGHSVYEDEALFERALPALSPFPNVILLLPCPDTDEAVAILKERYIAQAEEGETSPEELQMIEHFTRHPSNLLLAKHVVYTRGKSPEQTCAEMIQLLGT